MKLFVYLRKKGLRCEPGGGNDGWGFNNQCKGRTGITEARSAGGELTLS